MSHTPQSLQHEHVLFLNGLRGLAALMVFFDHTKQMINRINPFYYSDYFIFITNGTVGVHLLFVISGFALSLQFLRKRDIRIVLNLAAKRYPRLMIPILVACFLSYCLMSAGLMANATLPAAMQNKWFSQFFDFSPSFLGMLKFSVYDVFMNYNPKTAYITVLWSIAPEFTGSMLLLGALLFSHYGRWRIATYVLICLPMAFSNTVFFGFLIGVLLAEAYENKTVQQFRTQRYALPVSLICLACLADMPCNRHYPHHGQP